MIDKLQYNPLNLQATSVYNFNEFTLQELLNRFFQTINECVDSSNKALSFLEWLRGEGLSKEVKKYLDEMYNDGRLETLIDEYAGNLQSQIDSLDRGLDELNEETHNVVNALETKININKINLDTIINTISAFPLDKLNESDYIYIPKNTTLTVTSTLISLTNKKIRGEGKTSIIKVVGDIPLFNLNNTMNFEVSNLTIEVDTTNSSNIIDLSCTTGGSRSNVIKDIDIRCLNQQQGNYVGIKLYGENLSHGCFFNTIENVNIYGCREGITLEVNYKNLGIAWITGNVFNNILIRGFGKHGLALVYNGIDETDLGSGKVQITQNDFVNITCQDITMTNITRNGFILGGTNNFTNISSFADSGYGRFVGLKLLPPKAPVRGESIITGGMIEGLFEGLEWKNIYTINLFNFGVENSVQTQKSYMFKKIINNYSNVLLNSNFRNGKYRWNISNATGTVENDLTSETGRCLHCVNTTGVTTIFQPFPQKELLIGKKVSFILYAKSETENITISIDEGTGGRVFNNATIGKDYTMISIDKEIVGGNALNFQVTINGNIDIAWAMVDINGYSRNNVYIEDKEYGRMKNSGTAEVPYNATSIVVNHGLDITPLDSNIFLTPRNNLGNATKYFINNVTSTTFTINVDQNPTSVNASFNWNII